MSEVKRVDLETSADFEERCPAYCKRHGLSKTWAALPNLLPRHAVDLPAMTLYAAQKFLYHLNRDVQVQRRYQNDQAGLLADYDLTDEERIAIANGDIGKLYVLGCNGQLLMHFAPLLGVAWADYLEAMREGVRQYGPVRAGIYAMTTGTHEKVAGV